jgi:glycylpeptide N-tetradecanoyltransferase
MFLADNYVEDKLNLFRYNYSYDFIYWFLSTFKTINIGVFNNEELVGFICARFINLMILNKLNKMIEMDFLCVHKKYRNNSITTVLLSTLYNKCMELNIDNSIFTSQFEFSTKHVNKMATVNNYNRFLNIRTLIDNEYIKSNTNIKLLEEHYKLPLIKGNKILIKLTIDNMNNIDKCFDFYNKYYKNFDVYEIFTKDEFIKMFLNDHIKTFLLIEKINDLEYNILDFISYYVININALNTNNNINNGYLFYYTNLSNNLYKMILLLLNELKMNNVDILNAHNIMENNLVYDDLKFVKNEELSYFFFKPGNIKINNYKIAKLLF